MTKTENYQLPQWEAADPVRREDFNRAMANIDAGLMAKADQTALEEYRTGITAAVAAVDSKVNGVSSAADAALTQTKQELTAEIAAVRTASASAQTAANAAQTAANAAWSPQNPFFVTGSYRGTGIEDKNATLKITVGFQPSILIISNGTESYAAFGPNQPKLHKGQIAWDSDGVTLTDADPQYRLDQLNVTYYYCAFR